jgi:hypothetical protein
MSSTRGLGQVHMPNNLAPQRSIVYELHEDAKIVRWLDDDGCLKQALAPKRDQDRGSPGHVPVLIT